jgi:hypothetical protein
MNFCKQFILQHCNLTDGRVVSDDAVEGNDFIGQFGFDKVFVGSDTVFAVGAIHRERFTSLHLKRLTYIFCLLNQVLTKLALLYLSIHLAQSN